MPTDIFDEVAEKPGDVFDQIGAHSKGDIFDEIGGKSDFGQLQDEFAQPPRTGEERAARDLAATSALGLGTGNTQSQRPDLLNAGTELLGKGVAQAVNIIPNTIDTIGRATGSPSLAMKPWVEQGKPVPGVSMISDAVKNAVKAVITPKDVNGLPIPGDHPAAEGISQSVKQAVDSFGTPEGIATLPLLELKAARAIMAGDSALKTPEQIKQTVAVIQDPKATAEQKWKAIADSGVNLGMTAALGLSLHGGHGEAPAEAKAVEPVEPVVPPVEQPLPVVASNAPVEIPLNPGGAPSDLPPEKLAISKQNNSPEAFRAVQEQLDAAKAPQPVEAITPETIKDLQDRGYADSEIEAMTPQQAQEALAVKPGNQNPEFTVEPKDNQVDNAIKLETVKGSRRAVVRADQNESTGRYTVGKITVHNDETGAYDIFHPPKGGKEFSTRDEAVLAGQELVRSSLSRKGIPEPTASAQPKGSRRVDFPPDIIGDIVDNYGKIKPKGDSSSAEHYRGTYASAKKVRPELFSESGSRPDEIVDNLQREGKVGPNFSVDDLWDAINKAHDQRGVFSRGELPEQQQEKFQKALDKNSKKPSNSAVSISDLSVGDKFRLQGEEFTVKDINPDTGEVTVQDGRKFGRQTIPEGAPIHADANTLQVKSASTDFVPEEQPEMVGMGGAVPSEFGKTENFASNMFAAIEKSRKEMGLPPMEKTMRRTWAEDGDIALSRMNTNPEWIPDLIREVTASPRPLLSWENAGMAFQRAKWKGEYQNALQRIAQAAEDGRRDDLASARLDAALFEDKLIELDKAVGRNGTGSEAGRTLNAQKQAVAEDFSLVEMRLEKRNSANDGAPLTPKQEAEVEHNFKEIQEKQKALEEHVAKQQAKISELEANKAIDSLFNVENQGYNPVVLQMAGRLVKFLDTKADLARGRLKGRLKWTSAGVDPLILKDLAEIGASHVAHVAYDFTKWSARMVSDLGESIRPHFAEIWDATKKHLDHIEDHFEKPVRQTVKKAVKKVVTAIEKQTAVKEAISTRIKEGKPDTIGNLVQTLARTFVEQGVKGRDALIDAVHGVLKEIDPTMTRRDTMDAISGYGKFSQLSKDQVSVELRDLKGQMQQVAKLEDIQAKKPLQKTGVERRPQSDEERRLIQQVNEAKRRHGVVVTDPARQLKSSLDAIKTNLRNRISDLEYQIAQGKKTVKGKTATPLDAEATALKAEKQKLQEQFDAIFGKSELTDAQRVAIAKNALEKSIADYDRRIKEGDLSTKKSLSKTPNTPELQVLRAQRDALKSQFEDLRDAANPKRTPEQIANQSLRTRLTNRIAELEAKTAAGDFSTKPRRILEMEPETQKLKAAFEKVKQDYQDSKFKDKLAKRTLAEKVQDAFVKWGRAAILSSPGVLLKLTAAAGERIGFTPLEEGVGSVAGRILPGIAAKAPREGGGFNVRIEAKALTDGITKGMADAWQTLTKGKSEIELNYGKHEVRPRTWLDFFGSVHGALKAPAKRAEFSRSFEKRVEHAIKSGVDVADPLVQTRLAVEAYKDAQRAIFLNNNFIADRVKRFINSLEEPSKITGKTPAIGKAGATILHTLLPIIKVPTNIVAETAQYATGLGTGTYRLQRAVRAGVENLKPEEADLILRDLKKGSLGAAGLLLGFFAPNIVGGYYQPQEKRKPEDVKPGAMRIGGVNVPSMVLHNPLLATLQIGATIRHVADKQMAKGEGKLPALSSGALAGAFGLAEETPFIREMLEISKFHDPNQRDQALGDLVTSRVVPQAVQTAARYFDKNAEGQSINRKPVGVAQHIKAGIPGLRKEVPVNAKKPVKD